MDPQVPIDAAARTLGMKITAEQRPGVLAFHGLASAMAELVLTMPLTPADESGNVFRPVAPEVGE